MDLFYDWKFWLFVVSIGGALINWLANQKLMNNHLHHLAIDIKDIKTQQTNQSEKINHIDIDVAYIKGSKETEDKVLKILEKTLNNK